MSGPLYGRARRDVSEPEVVETFRKAGATIVQVSGKDVPDLFVGIWGEWHPVEVKSGKGKLKPGQQRWAETCRGERPRIARSRADALELLSQWQTAHLLKNAATGRLGPLDAPYADDPCQCERCTCGKDPEAPA